MDSNSLVVLVLVLVSVLGTLTALGALGGTALVAGAYVHERARRQSAEEKLDMALRQNVADNSAMKTMKAEIKRLTFIRGNKLLSRAMQDVDFAMNQSAIRLRVVKADMLKQLTEIEKILDSTKE